MSAHFPFLKFAVPRAAFMYGKLMRRLLLMASFMALLASSAMATDYYFDSNAASAGSGTLAAPFKSLASIPALVSGDVVKLARGSHWEDATISVNTHVTIENYGSTSLPKPILDGSRLVPYSDSVLNASEALQDANDPDSGIITMHTSAGTIVYGAFINDKFPLYRRPGTGPLDCTSANAAARATQRLWYESNTLKICRASLPPSTTIDAVRLVTTHRIIDLTTPSANLADPVKYIKISGLDIRYANDAGVGGAQNVAGVNYGKIYIENNDFRGILKTSICLCSAAGSDADYLLKGDKFDKLKVSGNRFYAHGFEAIYVGVSNSSESTDALPIEIVDNLFGEKTVNAANKYLISGWRLDTDAGAEPVDIKRGNKKALVARNVFLLNMKKKAIFTQSFDVEIYRNTINNTYSPGLDQYSNVSDTHNSAIWHQFEPPPTTMSGGSGVVTENSISNGAGSGILFRGATGIPASLNSERNQIRLIDDGTCSSCAGNVDGNSAFVVRAKPGYTFSLAGNVARGGKFAIRRFEETSIAPGINGDRFRGDAANTGYCSTNLLSGALPSPECIAGTQDTDGDGVYDDVDNCPALANAGQSDTDLNGIGDACDLAWQTNDIDSDGIYNTDDNDMDGDGIYNTADNCPSTANPDQRDLDASGIGDACEHGLTASYFNDTDTNGSGAITETDAKLVGPPVLQRREPNIDFNYAGSAEPGVVTFDNFSARFAGRLIVPAYTGNYTFCLKGDDGVRLWINNVNLFGDTHWKAQDSVTGCAAISLTAGQSVPIKMEFFDLTEEAIAQLTWSWSGQAAQVVPTTSLYAQ